ncbi:hypothetical protein JG687_00007463, partial [Phytophthora cactorum]
WWSRIFWRPSQLTQDHLFLVPPPHCVGVRSECLQQMLVQGRLNPWRTWVLLMMQFSALTIPRATRRTRRAWPLGRPMTRLLCSRALPAALNLPRMMASTSLQPPTRLARSLNPLIVKDPILKFSGLTMRVMMSFLGRAIER